LVGTKLPAVFLFLRTIFVRKQKRENASLFLLHTNYLIYLTNFPKNISSPLGTPVAYPVINDTV